MSDVIAYFLTWTTYGSWMPGDERGWVARGCGEQAPDSRVKEIANRMMVESEVKLSRDCRELVERTINRHCEIRNWHLHACAVRSNHVHVVVTAVDVDPANVREQLKAWATRRLRDEIDGARRKWWTEGGSVRFVRSDSQLERCIMYVTEAQDRKGRDRM
ncbi:transposase [Stratiformator vulcanicus]|uniref:Transposase IS200 like protein n=1 Tax=Stratiformator vulcanicus TaxID=2527980 RepID=A0A517QZB2_9PLAN|nr:transposase [Stratiformator vulcanicus]QDT36985.1 Transposase IS200 like protein [Stratiformator vulcanicus]